MNAVLSYVDPAVAVLHQLAAQPGAWEAVRAGAVLGLGACMPIGPVNVEMARRVLRGGVRAGVALGLGAVTVDVTYALLSTFSFVKVLNHPAVIVPVATFGALLLAYLGVQCLRAARKAWNVDPIARPLHPTEPFEVQSAAGAGSGLPLRGAQNLARRGKPMPAPAADCGVRPLAPDDIEALPTSGDLDTLRYESEDASTPTSATGSPHRAYLVGLLMTLLNPMTLIFWFSVVPAIGAGTGDPTSAGNGADRIAKAATGNLPMMCAGVFIGTVAWVLTFSSLMGWASAAAENRSAKAGGRDGARRKWLAAADAVGGVTLLGFAIAAGWRLATSGAFLRLLGPVL